MAITSIIDPRLLDGSADNQVGVWDETNQVFNPTLTLSGLTSVETDALTVNNDILLTGGGFIGVTGDTELMEFAAGIVTINGDITLENAEFIKNDVNGTIRIGGAGGTTNNWIDFKFDSNVGSTDLYTSATNFRFNNGLTMADNIRLLLGSGGDSALLFNTNAGSNDHLQIATFLGSSNGAGFVSMVEMADRDSANRGVPIATDPTFRIFSADATQADDWIQFCHDQTNGVIEVGNGHLSVVSDLVIAGTTDCGTSCEANAYTVGGVAGTDFSGAVTSITVVKGIVTAAA